MAKAKSKLRKSRKSSPEKDLAPILRDDIEQIMEDYYRGNRIQLFHAIIRCGQYGIPLHEWITHEVREAFRKYTSAEVRTLDEAFGIELDRKGKKLPAEQDRVKKAYRVYQEIEDRRREGKGLGPELYELVGRGFNISGSTARRYYEDVRRTLPT